MSSFTLIPIHNQGVPGPFGADFTPTPAKVPLGIYVHIPFCVRKCHYCDFHSGPASDEIRDQYVDALLAEIRHTPWRGHAARTVFFGGGTPSELSNPQLARITAALREAFDFGLEISDCGLETAEPFGSRVVPSAPRSIRNLHPPDGGRQSPVRNPEWTIECNPGTVTEETLVGMREMGFNRISLGVQSFWDHHLKAIGRIHTADQAREAVAAARRAGFRRLNVDLIFCLPDQTLDEWKADLEQALALDPEHVSLYNLTIEENTEFGRRHRMGALALPDEDLSADMYEWAIDQTAAIGMEQYEVSNFAYPGEECRHNQIYWRQEPYIGFGLSAASYWEGLRWTNATSMQRYLATAARPEGPVLTTEERLPPADAAGEAVMLGLRTREGADLAAIAAQYGLDPEAAYGSVAARLEADGLVTRRGWRLRLTRRGIMLANAVCGEFLES